jgi:hypothetical protein
MNELAESRPKLSIPAHRAARHTASGRQPLWMLLGLFVATALLRIFFLSGTGLWGDEVFSLAVATGHSLEGPAAAARPELGDFVEPDHPVPA